MRWSKSLVILLGYFLLLQASCYTFRDVSIDPEVKTVSVQYIANNARIVSPTLSQILTEKLKTKFIRESRLSVVQTDGDFAFSGTITDYNVNPVTLQGNTTGAAKNRLTITVNIKFVNVKDEKASFEQSFSRFSDFDASIPFAGIENQLVADITDQLVQEIFNKAAVNW